MLACNSLDSPARKQAVDFDKIFDILNLISGIIPIFTDSVKKINLGLYFSYLLYITAHQPLFHLSLNDR